MFRSNQNSFLREPIELSTFAVLVSAFAVPHDTPLSNALYKIIEVSLRISIATCTEKE